MLGGPLWDISQKDFTKPSTWQEVSSFVKNFPITIPASHWSENYSNTMDIDHPEALGDKGVNVKKLLDELEYETATDVACNKGYYSFLAARKAKSVIGFDLVPACIKQAQEFNNTFKLPVVFAVKTIQSIIDNKLYEENRYSSDLVIALAIVHHVKNEMSSEKFAGLLTKLSKKYILIEDVDQQVEYQNVFSKLGFSLHKRLSSSPQSRTLSVYRKM
jgi:SAM-dependent methyltransferase